MTLRAHFGSATRAAHSVLFSAIALVACGEATCPKGSTSIDGDCVAAEPCADGKELVDGQCMSTRGIVSDAGSEDAVVDRRDSAVEAGGCSALDCGLHAHCDESLMACVCDPGWQGEQCDLCPDEMGLSLDGVCVPICESTQAPACGEHGVCAVVEGAAGCECERGYGGELCADCADLFRLDDDGVCVADCGDCGAHGLCDDTAEIPTCLCAPGYRDDGEGCHWIGDGENGAGLVDGEIEDANAWQTRHVAIDRGAATFVNAIVDGECELGWLAQRFPMPTREQAEPFVLDLVVTTSCTSTDPAQCPPLLVEAGAVVSRVQVPGAAAGSTRTVSVCLGESAYGDDVALRIRPGLVRGTTVTSPSAFECETAAWPKIEAVSVRAATTTECPLDAGVTNGEFDAAEGWTLRSSVIGDGRLQLESAGTATTHIVVPTTAQMPSPALRINTAAPSSMQVVLGGLIWSQTSGVLCLPDWTHGIGQELELRAMSAPLTIDAVTIESDPKCGDGRLDAGFERERENAFVGAHGSWGTLGGYPTVAREAAHTGSQGVRFTGAINGLHALMRIPESTTTSHPAFALQHRANGSSVTGGLDVLPLGVSVNQFSSSQWTLNLTCLDRQWEGQLILAGLAVGFSGTDNPSIDIDEAGPILSDSCD